MANQSRRHHYIPIFLTKNFTKENGKIYIYDKLTDKVFDGHPNNIFIEKDRNTFLNEEDLRDDRIEKMYADLDTIFATTIAQIKVNGDLNNGKLKILLFLAYIIKWRVPQYDESFDDAKNIFSVDDLGLGFKDEKDEKLDINLEQFFDKEMYQEIKRFLLAIQPFRFKEDFKKIIDNSFVIASGYPALIGDCPFNEIHINSEEIFEDFVFPFTENLTLVYSQRIDKFDIQDFLNNGDIDNVDKFLKDFSMARDLSTMALSGRFTGSSDEEYLKNFVYHYKIGLQSDNLSKTMSTAIFQFLYKYKDYNNTK